MIKLLQHSALVCVGQVYHAGDLKTWKSTGTSLQIKIIFWSKLLTSSWNSFYFVFKLGYSNLYPHPRLSRNRKIPWGEGIFFQMENSMEGGIFELEISRRGLKILTKCWKFHGREVNSVWNSMGGWLTCVGNSMEWSKNAVGNSMGGIEKNEVPWQGWCGYKLE